MEFEGKTVEGKTELLLRILTTWLLFQQIISLLSIESLRVQSSHGVHTKYMFSKKGNEPEEYNTAFLGKVRPVLYMFLLVQRNKRRGA